MNREEIQKLLGGYATGTLTPEEQQALFAAALEDQDLFDALGREQALRDLLRDPAAKAELLAALDEPKSGGFWAWLRRPMVAGLATAAVAAVAIIAVWQGTRGKPVAQTRVMVAEMKVTDAPSAPPAVVQEAPPKVKREFAKPREVVNKDVAAVENAPVSPSPPPPAPAPVAAPAAAPASVGSVAKSVEVTANASALPVQGRAVQMEKLTQDARSLFYGNSFVPGAASAPVPSVMGGSAGAQSVTMRAAVAKKENAPASLGVRVSILRGDVEAAMTTVLDPGESVRLKLTPNADGFLYVAARDDTGWKMVASGPAQRLKPFETPVLPFGGSGQRQLYVMLSRQPQTLSPQALAGLARANLVETLADQDRATYVVAGLQNGAPQQVVQPITLTYK